MKRYFYRENCTHVKAYSSLVRQETLQWLNKPECKSEERNYRDLYLLGGLQTYHVLINKIKGGNSIPEAVLSVIFSVWKILNKEVFHCSILLFGDIVSCIFKNIQIPHFYYILSTIAILYWLFLIVFMCTSLESEMTTVMIVIIAIIYWLSLSYPLGFKLHCSAELKFYLNDSVIMV